MRQIPDRSSGWTATEWVLGIVGGIAAFLGFFILFGPEDEYVGLGGELSWRVGDITAAWTWSLLIGGLVLFAAAAGMVLYRRRQPRATVAPVVAARSDLYTHAGIFLLVNAFIWIQDIAIGGGVEYAFWVTIPWGIGLLAHALAHFYSAGREVPATSMVEEEEKELLPH